MVLADHPSCPFGRTLRDWTVVDKTDQGFAAGWERWLGLSVTFTKCIYIYIRINVYIYTYMFMGLLGSAENLNQPQSTISQIEEAGAPCITQPRMVSSHSSLVNSSCFKHPCKLHPLMWSSDQLTPLAKMGRHGNAYESSHQKNNERDLLLL